MYDILPLLRLTAILHVPQRSNRRCMPLQYCTSLDQLKASGARALAWKCIMSIVGHSHKLISSAHIDRSCTFLKSRQEPQCIPSIIFISWLYRTGSQVVGQARIQRRDRSASRSSIRIQSVLEPETAYEQRKWLHAGRDSRSMAYRVRCMNLHQLTISKALIADVSETMPAESIPKTKDLLLS